MSQWKRDESRDEIELAAQVPDDRAVLDDAGGIIGWDETAAHEYERRNNMTTECSPDCVARVHIRPL